MKLGTLLDLVIRHACLDAQASPVIVFAPLESRRKFGEAILVSPPNIRDHLS